MEKINETRPNIVLIPVGGTIAAQTKELAGGAVPVLSGYDLLDLDPRLREIANFRVVPFASMDSSEMTPELWISLAKVLDRTLADETVDGALITHGSDTMEESAFFLDLTLQRQKPVVLTGAMRHSSSKDSDGPRNLIDAVRTILSQPPTGIGVVVVMNSYIFSARSVTKVNTHNVQAFSGGFEGCLGMIDDQWVNWFQVPVRGKHFPIPKQLPRVDIIMTYPGSDGSLLRASVDYGSDGIVVISYGLGNVNRPTFEAIEYACSKNVPVLLTTRVPSGRIYPVYASFGGGVRLKKLGVVFNRDYKYWKARILFMLALLKTKNSEELQEYFL